MKATSKKCRNEKALLRRKWRSLEGRIVVCNQSKPKTRFMGKKAKTLARLWRFR